MAQINENVDEKRENGKQKKARIFLQKEMPTHCDSLVLQYASTGKSSRTGMEGSRFFFQICQYLRQKNVFTFFFEAWGFGF